MKHILISIKPKWVEKILNGDKTIEIRKTRPKCELPCKVYIYETKGKGKFVNCGKKRENIGGKVVAEFTLNVVEDFEVCSDDFRWLVENTKCCLTMDEVLDYCKGQDLYGWHIDDLIIYDKPKELNEFTLPECEKSECACGNCKYLEVINTPYAYETNCVKPRTLTRPPQSWCYVEKIKE